MYCDPSLARRCCPRAGLAQVTVVACAEKMLSSSAMNKLIALSAWNRKGTCEVPIGVLG
jgi:hypothetical protein